MDLVELHRTFLYSDQVSGSQRMRPNVCQFHDGDEPVEPPITVTGPGGSPAPRPVQGREWVIGPHEVVSVIRQCQTAVANDHTPAGRYIHADGLTFPDMKTRRIVSWEGQNFFAHATDWEKVHSKLVAAGKNGKEKFTPVLDKFGLVIGHFLKGVSTRELWVDDDGQLYYHKDFNTHTQGFTPRGNQRFAGAEVYLTADDRIMAWTESAGHLSPQDLANMTHTKIPGNSTADIMVDIEGNVVSIHMYDPIWRPKFAPTGEVLILALFDALAGLPEGCEPGAIELDPTCHQQQGGGRVFLFFTVLLWDLAGGGGGAAAKLTGLIYPGSKVLQQYARLAKQIANVAVKGGQQVAKVATKGATAGARPYTTLVLRGASRGRGVLTSNRGDLIPFPRKRGESKVLGNAEMEVFLRETIRARPYLDRLRAIQRQAGQELIDQLNIVIREWQKMSGKLYRVVPRGMVQKLGSQGVGGWALDPISGKEVLVIEQQAVANPAQFLDEVTHELAYEAVREAAGVPAIAVKNLKHLRFANTLLERALQNPQGTWNFLAGLE